MRARIRGIVSGVRNYFAREIRAVINQLGYDIRKTWFIRMRLPDRLELRSGERLAATQAPLNYPDRAVTLLYLNVGEKNRALLENSVKSARESGFRGDIIVYDDQPDCAQSKRIIDDYQASFVDLRRVTQSGLKGSAGFGDTEFQNITYLKWTIIRLELQKFANDNDLLIFSDADLVFLGDFRDYFVSAAECWSIGIQSESRAKFPTSFCIGLMYFTRDSMETVGQFERITLDNQGRGTAQQILNEIVLANPALSRMIHSLPEAVFPVGLSYSLVAGEPHPLQVHRPELLAFHANWVNGHEAKIKMLDDLGLWKI